MAKPAATEAFPILTTSSFERALAFYRDLLGGVVVFSYPGPDGSDVYVGLDVGSSHIGIGGESEIGDVPQPRPISLWIYTDDCDALFDVLKAAGTTIVAEPSDQPWGERVARVLDPDGNEVIIGQRQFGVLP